MSFDVMNLQQSGAESPPQPTQYWFRSSVSDQRLHTLLYSMLLSIKCQKPSILKRTSSTAKELLNGSGKRIAIDVAVSAVRTQPLYQ